MESIKELRQICQTKKQPMYMQLVSTRISIYVTKLYLYTGLSADYVTIFMMLLVIAGSIIMATGSLWNILIGILLIHFTIILDNVNGEVARYNREDGLIGTFLEQVYHNLAVPLLFFSVSFGVFSATGIKSVLVFGFLASIFGMPIILKSIKDAVIDERLSEIKKGKHPKKISLKSANIQGGSSLSGSMLYYVYEKFRAVWVYPANIVHITVLAIIEILNIKRGYFPQYSLFVYYILAYGFVSAIVQSTAFIVNYRGKTIDHYYKELFGK
ncbi:MAG TPA: hypothetical protein VJI97_01575 [Candidatus Nanoarchaeia archaeon]|nr:hypothetical protein [Candidatus Nanoarchaeia archaeon]